MRAHLASLLDDFRRNAADTAIVSHRGVRSYRTTYGELALLAGRFSSELQRRNIRPGDRVLLCGDNSAEWLAAFFGCVLRGVLAVPLDVAGSLQFAEHVLEEVSPQLIVADPGKLDLPTHVPRLALPDLRDILPPKPNYEVDPAVKEDAPFQIIFTSGTTAEPKGVVHTHRNVLASLRPIEAEMNKYRRYESWFHPLRFLHTVPLSHVFGQFMGLWIPGLLAAELHFTDSVESDRLMGLIHRDRISVLIAVPRVLGLLRSHLMAVNPSLGEEMEKSNALSIQKRWWHFRSIHRSFGWRFWAVICGGAALAPELERFWNRLGFAVIQGYGMTETAALVTLNHPFQIGQGTIGRALPGREVRLSDTGELLVRGDVVAPAMWSHGQLLPRDGEWLRTGDLAEKAESGDFRFLGRKGDVIVTSSGLNIHPSDLEAAVLRQPGVQACAVVPCDLEMGPEPVCVVLFDGDDAALERTINVANQSLAEFQQVRRVLRWPGIAFPYTSTGKLLRREVREWACGMLHGQRTASSSSEDFLLATIGSITGEQPSANRGDDLQLSEDLHLDSLGRVQLASVLEQRTGVMVDDAEMASLHTLGELRRVVSATRSLDLPQALQAPPETASAERVPGVSNQVSPRAGEVTVPTARLPQARYPRWPWLAPVRALRRVFVEAVLRPLVGLLLAPRVSIPEAPLDGPFLIVSNHVTMLDAALVIYALPRSIRRRLAIMMSGEILEGLRSGQSYGILGRIAYGLVTSLFHVFPLPRLYGFRQSFAHAGYALDRGYSVLNFPEGTRSRTGEMGPFRRGIGLLAQEAQVPVLPVALMGLEKIRGKGTRWFRSGKLEIAIGTPVQWARSRSASSWTTALEQKLLDMRRSSDPAALARIEPVRPVRIAGMVE